VTRKATFSDILIFSAASSSLLGSTASLDSSIYLLIFERNSSARPSSSIWDMNMRQSH